jgi:ribosome-binding factor A
VATQRQMRVQELLRGEISGIIRTVLQDPAIGFVTVTDMAVSPDLRHAKVFVSVLGTEAQRGETLKALRRAAKFMRAELAQRVQLKHTPELVFRFDPTVERAARVEELLKQISDTSGTESGTDTTDTDDH